MSLKSASGRGSFLVKVNRSDEKRLEGTIHWIDEDKVTPFRSAMEMLKLIDEVVKREEDDLFISWES